MTFSVTLVVEESSASPSVRLVGVRTMPRSSSSVSVSVMVAGFAMPPLVTVPDTLTVLFAASKSLSFAVMVTVPVLVVVPAAMVSIRLAPQEMSRGRAGLTAIAFTVMVMARSAGPFSVAVTVAMPPFSLMDALSSASVTARSSSSVTSTETDAAVSLA